MSQESVERIIGKAILDVGFRNALLADPDLALVGFHLSEAEKIYIKRMDAETLDLLANILTEMGSKWQMEK